MKIHEIILRPIITEKTSALARSNVYAFEVHKDANKHQITQALKNIYAYI